MKYFLSIIFLVFLYSNVAAQTGKDLGYWDFIKNDKITESVVILKGQGTGFQGEIYNFLGTSVVVGKNTLLTAEHCTTLWIENNGISYNKLDSISVKVQGKWYKARVKSKSSKIDLAVLTTDKDLPVTPIKIAKSFDKKDKFEHIGWAGQTEVRHFKTRYMGRSVKTDVDFYSYPVIEGDSGGAIINSKNELVGIVVAGTGHIHSIKKLRVYAMTNVVSLKLIKGFLE